MNFRSNNTRRFLKPSSYMLLSLKAVRWDFLIENRLGAGAVRIWSCWSFHRFIIILCVVSSERKILQTAQIRNFEPKEPHHKTGNINLRLFSMYLFIFYVITRNSASRSVNPINICYKNANAHKNANVHTNSLSGLPVVKYHEDWKQ